MLLAKKKMPCVDCWFHAFFENLMSRPFWCDFVTFTAKQLISVLTKWGASEGHCCAFVYRLPQIMLYVDSERTEHTSGRSIIANTWRPYIGRGNMGLSPNDNYPFATCSRFLRHEVPLAFMLISILHVQSRPTAAEKNALGKDRFSPVGFRLWVGVLRGGNNAKIQTSPLFT